MRKLIIQLSNRENTILQDSKIDHTVSVLQDGILNNKPLIIITDSHNITHYIPYNKL